MIDASTLAADAAALAESPEAIAARALAEEKRLAAEAAAAAKAAHEKLLGELTALHDGVGAKLGVLQAHLASSLAKAGQEPDHAGYTASFLRDVELKADELIAWIQRHV